jgi:hypothetical protein
VQLVLLLLLLLLLPPLLLLLSLLLVGCVGPQLQVPGCQWIAAAQRCASLKQCWSCRVSERKATLQDMVHTHCRYQLLSACPAMFSIDGCTSSSTMVLWYAVVCEQQRR